MKKKKCQNGAIDLIWFDFPLLVQPIRRRIVDVDVLPTIRSRSSGNGFPSITESLLRFTYSTASATRDVLFLSVFARFFFLHCWPCIISADYLPLWDWRDPFYISISTCVWIWFLSWIDLWLDLTVIVVTYFVDFSWVRSRKNWRWRSSLATSFSLPSSPLKCFSKSSPRAHLTTLATVSTSLMVSSSFSGT